jgi:2-C-methyl-D-erythritol 2,4-cyclodiphosphate synthase
MRTGIGFDSHPLTAGRKLVLGGVQVPFDRGPEGWSDADVLIHAIMDALLGAAALGDIGMHFPPGRPEYQGISSLVLLGQVVEKLEEKGYRVGNIDATVIAEAPRLREYIDEMRHNLAHVLAIPDEQVSLKASTSNGLGFIGRGDGIAALAIVLLEEIS